MDTSRKKRLAFNVYLFPKPNIFLSYKSWESRLYLLLFFFKESIAYFVRISEYVKRINMLEYLRHDFVWY